MSPTTGQQKPQQDILQQPQNYLTCLQEDDGDFN